MQLQDRKWDPILTKIIDTKKCFSNFWVKHGILIFAEQNMSFPTKPCYQICIPHCVAPNLVKKFHEEIFFQHADKNKLITNLNHRFKIQGVGKIAEKVIQICTICTSNKAYNHPKTGLG